MGMQTFGLAAGRLNKFKGQILKHAEPLAVLQKQGRQISFPRNNSDTYVARKFLPYGATPTSAATQNQFFPTANGDRGNVITQAHLTQEGVTPTPDSITPMDVTVVMQQYACLYGFTDKTFLLYEDDIPKEMVTQVGERVSLVNEMILWGALRACTNQYYGGTGTTIATVNGGLTLNLVRKIVMGLQANHGKMVSRILKASADFDTATVAPGYFVYGHTDLEPDISDLPDFVPVWKYASGKPEPNELGSVGRFRFILSPDLPSFQNGGAAIGATGLYSTSASNLDVYPFIVVAQDAFSQVAVKGMESLNPTFIPTGVKSPSDQFGQRGYAGTMWWKAVMIENNGWMAVGNVGRAAL